MANHTKRYGFEDIDAIWRRLQEPARHGMPAVQRELGTLRDPHLGLGLQLRWNLAMLVLLTDAPHGDTQESLRLRLDLPEDFFRLNSLNTGSRAEKTDAALTRKAFLASRACDPEKLGALCRLLNERFLAVYQRRLGCRGMTEEGFRCRLSGADAVQRFTDFLRTGASPLESRVDLVQPVEYLASTRRKREFDKLLGWLDNPKARPVRGVSMPGAPSGQCAVAHELARRLQARQGEHYRPVLLLPCGRQYRNPHHCGLDFLVYNLLAFLKQEPFKEEEGVALTPPELEQYVTVIRRLLAWQPVVVVLVGYAVTNGAQAHLRRVIRDEPVMQLLPQLLRPMLEDARDPPPAELFRHTRWVILSDGPLDILEAYREDDIAMPSPDPSAMPRVLRMFTADVAHLQPLQQLADAAGLFLPEAKTCAALQLLRLADRSGRHDTALEWYGLFDTLARTLRSGDVGALDAAALHFIALAESGMRHLTLWRCLRRWLRSGAEGVPGDAGHWHLPAPGGEASWTSSFLQRYEALIYCGADRLPTDLNPLEHPFEYSDHAADTASLASGDNACFVHQSLDFRFAEVRNALVADLRRERPAYMRSMLQVLATEALTQHALQARHGRPGQPATLRDLRCALEGLYCGLLSLPEGSDVVDGGRDRWSRPGDLAAWLPADPVDRFHFLRSTVFGGLIEGGEQCRLRRQWGADDVRLDVLELVHLAFAGEKEREQGLAAVPAWWLREELCPEAGAVFHEHCQAVAEAAQGANDMARWQAFRRGLDETIRRPASAAGFRLQALAPLEFDMALMRSGPAQERTVRLVEDRVRDLLAPVELKVFTLSLGGDGGSLARITLPRAQELGESLVRLCSVVGHPGSEAGAASERWPELAGWLVRLGELRYQMAQLQWGNKPRRWKLTLECLALSHVAAHLRKAYFGRHPLAVGSPLPMARDARSLVRAALDLVRLLPLASSTDGRDDDQQRTALRALLLKQVRCMLDAPVFDSAAPLPDSPSMLVLEARYARVAGAQGPYEGRRHEFALRLLQTAEQRLLPMQGRHRHWLRFLIERCATLRGQARAISRRQLQASGPASSSSRVVADAVKAARRLLELALTDARELDWVVDAAYPAAARSDESVRALYGAWKEAIDYQRRCVQQELDAIGPPTGPG